MQILATDGGPHPADKWAVATARELVPTESVSDGTRLIKALKLQAAVAEALEPHHQGVHDAERTGLKANGSSHLLTDFDAGVHTPDALEAILAASSGTPWEGHFADPEVQTAVVGVLSNHFNTSASIERQWHCDRNPTDPIAVAFKAQHHNETVVPTDEPAS